MQNMPTQRRSLPSSTTVSSRPTTSPNEERAPTQAGSLKSVLIWAVVLLISVAVLAYSIPIFVWASAALKEWASTIVTCALALTGVAILALLADRLYKNICEERRKDFKAGLLSANEGGNYQIPVSIRTGKNTYEPRLGAPKPVVPQVLHQGNDAALLNLAKEMMREIVKQRGVVVTEELPLPLLPPMKSGRDLIEDGTVRAALASGRIVLGYDDEHKVRYMKVAHFFSCILGGIPNSGKSSTAVWLLVQLIWAGVRILCVDPHMNYQDEEGHKGLAQELEPFQFAYLPQFPPCDMSDPQAVLARTRWMRVELDRRKRPGYIVRASEIIIMAIDEYNSVIEVEEISEELSDDLAYIEREGRKFGVHVMLLGHRWARDDIGNIKVRTCASTILAHRFNDEGQGKCLLGQSDGKKVLDLEPGFYWLRGILSGALARVYTPYLQADDISTVIRAMSATGFTSFPDQATIVEAERMPDSHARPVSGASGPETFGNVRETPVSTAWRANPTSIDGMSGNTSDEGEEVSTKEKNAPVETAIRETIRRMKEAHESDRKIARFVGLSGRKYGVYQQVCRDLGFVAEKAEGEE